MKRISKLEEFIMRINAYYILKRVEKNPELKNIKPPPDLREKVYAQIRKRDEERLRKLNEGYGPHTAEELLVKHLRACHRREQILRRCHLIGIAAIILLTLGITSMGGADKAFYKVTGMFAGRERDTIDSVNVEETTDFSEEDAYAEIEKKFGFYPVKLVYIPHAAVFQEFYIFEDMPAAYLIYGNQDGTVLSYWIRPNYMSSSWTKDVEDQLLDESQIELENLSVNIKKYAVDNNEVRWLIQFDYQDVNYSMYIMNVHEEDIEKIIKSIHIP